MKTIGLVVTRKGLLEVFVAFHTILLSKPLQEQSCRFIQLILPEFLQKQRRSPREVVLSRIKAIENLADALDILRLEQYGRFHPKLYSIKQQPNKLHWCHIG